MLSPDGRCKSFDSRANGYVRGEGAGIVILKPLARALADGDRIYAVIRATAVNQDGRTAGISVPSQASQEANIVECPAARRYRAGEHAVRGSARDRNAGGRPDRGCRARCGLRQGTKARRSLRDRLDQEQYGSSGGGARGSPA